MAIYTVHAITLRVSKLLFGWMDTGGVRDARVYTS